MQTFTSHFLRSDGRIRGCYVYMLLCEEEQRIYVKIGSSVDPIKRLKQLTTGCPLQPEVLAVVELPGKQRANNLEHALHLALEQWRSSGEWFKFQQSDRQVFNDIWRPILQTHSSPGWRLAWTKVSIPELRQEYERQRALSLKKSRQCGGAYRDFRRHNRG
jgi:hypothetical protein